MKTINLLVFIALILVIPLSSASYGTFKPNTEISLTQTCDNGVSICNSCNITNIKNPNSDILLSNVVMTKRTADFNYSFSNTSVYGIYTVTGYCFDSGIWTNWMYHFTVGNTYIPILLIFLFIGAFAFLILSMFGNTEFFLFVSGALYVIAGIVTMTEGLGNLADWTTRAISFISIGVGFLLILGAYLDSRQEYQEEDSD